MKTRILALLAAVAGSVLLAASSAQAITSVSMIWRDPGSGTPGFGATIGTPSVSASSIVIADIVLAADAAGVTEVFISIEFDATELQAITTFPMEVELASVNLPGMGNFFLPMTPGVSFDNINGLIEGFDQVTFGSAQST